MRRRLLVMVAIALIVVACGSGGTSSKESTIKIALEGPLTGDQSSTGVDMLHGATLAVADANRTGGVLGKRIELAPADDKADASTGLQVAAEMVSSGVFAVIGPYNSSVGIKNLKTYLDAGIVTIHLTSNSATNGQGFTIQPKDYQVAPVEAAAIKGFFRATSAAIIYDTSTYTAGIAAQVRDALTRARVPVLAYTAVGSDTNAYGRVVSDVEASGADLIYVSTYFPEGAVIAKDLQRTGSGATCLMGLANQDPGFATAAGLTVARRCNFSGVPSAENFPLATKYVDDYRASFGQSPGTWGTFTYDSVSLLFDAVRRANAWDAPKVREELARTTNFEGITGVMSIDSKTGNRKAVPVVILSLGNDGRYRVNAKWAAFAGFGS